MESSIMNGMCRCCASEGVFKDVKTSYTWMGEEEVYADMLKDCFDINLSTSDTIEDGGICEVCITQLRNASNFKKQVLNTEEQFKKHALNKLFKPNIVKVEVNADDDDNDSDDNVLSGEEGYSGPEYEVPIKTESDDPKPKKRAAASKATTSRAKKAKTDSGESSTKRPPANNVKVKEESKSRGDTKDKKVAPRSKRILLKSTKTEISELDKHRTNIDEVIHWSNATPIRSYGDMGYRCYFCVEQYIEPADLKKHTIETHPDIRKSEAFKKLSMDKFFIKADVTALQCKICNQDLKRIEELLEHLKSLHQKIVYTDIKNHIIPFKFATETLQCLICDNKFSKFKILQEHMHIHYRHYICDVCDTGYFNCNSLYIHKRIHKTGTFPCGFCPKILETKTKRQLHEKTKHIAKSVLFKCGYCNENFNDFRKKEAHLITLHGLKVPTPKCQSCEKVFVDRSKLLQHTKRVHLMQKPNKCNLCDMSFCTTSELRDHMTKHIGLKVFKCNICSKAYARAKTLKEHMKIHDDVRRFKCEHCRHTFVQKCSWKVHMKSKHGVFV